MPTYQFEAMDASGKEIKDVVEAVNEDEAAITIKKMGYYLTKLSVRKERKTAAVASGNKKGKTFTLAGVKSKVLCTFTRQLSILQDAGLPILRSLKILEGQAKPGALKNALIDVIDEIEGGATLSEAMAKCPKAFNRLYVNMIKAGEAGGALEIILQRLAEFTEKSEALKRKIKGALTYPICVVMFSVGILAFLMVFIIPKFIKIFEDFDTTLPVMTQWLIFVSNMFLYYWWILIAVPVGIWLLIKMMNQFDYCRFGWNLFTLKMPVFGQLVEKNAVARAMRTLGTLVSSGVPIIEAITITRETTGNGVFERLFDKILEAIRQGESIAKPIKENAVPPIHPIAIFWWCFFCGGPIGLLLYMMKFRQKIMDDMVVNMIDVGEETGELDKMLYKVADTFDDEVNVLTDSLMSLMEPLLIIFLGGMVGFIVISLFMPLISLISKLSG
ncbi:MAG: type II secretion system F family protein [Thermoguttaceae bacterium]|nr:type II secretion system F family protein [Thermoguttaceae bacterium]MBQ6617443.1 type II secretion system F family protein [Thermoguttaceae bacterium]